MEAWTYPGGFPTARKQYGVSEMYGNYAQIAEGMGAVGLVVESPAELVDALKSAQRLNKEGTVLVDVHSACVLGGTDPPRRIERTL